MADLARRWLKSRWFSRCSLDRLAGAAAGGALCPCARRRCHGSSGRCAPRRRRWSRAGRRIFARVADIARAGLGTSVYPLDTHGRMGPGVGQFHDRYQPQADYSAGRSETACPFTCARAPVASGFEQTAAPSDHAGDSTVDCTSRACPAGHVSARRARAHVRLVMLCERRTGADCGRIGSARWAGSAPRSAPSESGRAQGSSTGEARPRVAVGSWSAESACLRRVRRWLSFGPALFVATAADAASG